MELLREFAERGLPYVPSVVTVGLVVLGLILANRVVRRRTDKKEDGKFQQQMIMLGLTVVGLLVVVTALPISDSTKGQLLSLLGILLSAAIALSSTTFLGNALAGVMMRAVRAFRIGDFVRVNDHFGRVTERGLFHTEIQTEERELTTLPNLYLVTHPMTTLRSSGTIVSATVSLGYDVPRSQIESLLLRAAEDAGLEGPYVQVLELGDFSVVYRAAGMLTEVKRLISVRSKLRAAMLDRLHEGHIEIVSPTFMNTRAIAPGTRFIPGEWAPEPRTVEDEAIPEERIFDKADEAEREKALEEAVERAESDEKGGGGEDADADGKTPSDEA